MRKLHPLYYLFVVISVAFQGPAKHHYIVFENAKELQQFLNCKALPYPLLSAHRGEPMPNFPENGIEIFENATAYQPVIIEFDVALRKDSALVIMHDDKLDRTCTRTEPVANHTCSQLQKFYLKYTDGKVTKFKIPTLKEVLIWGRGKVIFTVDIKTGVPCKKIVEAVHDQIGK